jgi:hypothetical protein
MTGSPTAAEFVHVTFLLQSGEKEWLVRIHEGRIESIQSGPFVMPRWTFRLAADAQAWSRYYASTPTPGFHDLMAMIKFKHLRLEGDQHPFMSNLLYFKDLVKSLGGSCNEPPTHGTHLGRLRPRHHPGPQQPHLCGNGGPGPALLCLHTAGNDSRQYRGLMNCPEITERLQVICFDLPYHGKSSPRRLGTARVPAHLAALCGLHPRRDGCAGHSPPRRHGVLHRRPCGAAPGAAAPERFKA